ncbi:hypothetical protein ACFLU8_01155 [Chloroflexota bacterium]
MRTLIISQAIHDSKTMPRRALAVRLQDLIQKMGEVSPTEDTLVRMISAARNQQPSELERPWSIGASSQYNIPADIVPLLIKVRQSRIREMKDLDLPPRKLTIRQAQWFARLQPAVEALVKLQYPFDVGETLRYLEEVVTFYEEKEQVSEILNEQYPDTSRLDEMLFVNEDLSFDTLLEAWWSLRTDEQKKGILKALERIRKSTITEQESKLGRHLADSEIEWINNYFAAATNGPRALSEWEKQYPASPQLRVLPLSWVVVYAQVVEDKQNERKNNQAQR